MRMDGKGRDEKVKGKEETGWELVGGDEFRGFFDLFNRSFSSSVLVFDPSAPCLSFVTISKPHGPYMIKKSSA